MFPYNEIVHVFDCLSSAVPDPGLSVGYIVLICLCVLLLVAAAPGVMCYIKYSKKWKGECYLQRI